MENVLVKKVKINGVTLEFHQEIDQLAAHELAKKENATMVDLTRSLVGTGSLFAAIANHQGSKIQDCKDAVVVISMLGWQRWNSEEQLVRFTDGLNFAISGQTELTLSKIMICGYENDLKLFKKCLNQHLKQAIA